MPRTIILAASLPAPPDRLYEMYVDPELHAAFTGLPVTIGSEVGAPFRAFNGAIWGSILHVVANRLIVQRWRSVKFPEDAIDSTLTLSFWPEGTGGRIELVQANVPEEDFAGVSEGWSKFYWNPWRAYLAQNV
jgi:activator of HSP90 ATPase